MYVKQDFCLFGFFKTKSLMHDVVSMSTLKKSEKSLYNINTTSSHFLMFIYYLKIALWKLYADK